MKKKEAPLEQVRIIGIFAHVDAGKTTTSEAILYYTGRIHRAGSIDDGTTQLDWMTQERERGITIMSAATACHWREHRINLIDTPGHIDFTAEVVRSIRVIDGAVIVLCAVGGVEPQTETVWRHADREHLPRVVFINKLDRLGADFDRTLAEVRQRLTPNAIPLQLPIGREGTFTGVIDLLRDEALVWADGEENHQVQPVPSEMHDIVARHRQALLDSICETDEHLLEMRLEGHEPDFTTVQQALRRATISGELVPVLCGASRNRLGVTPLIDAVVDYLPAPVDRHPVLGTVPGHEDEVVERPSDPHAPLCATAFKIVTDPHVGHLTWVRVFSGQLRVGESVLNPRTDDVERVGRIYRMHAARREQVDHMAASDVVALVGVKSARTGDTLCDPEHPIVLETLKFPEPVIAVALAPGSEAERDRLRQAVNRLCDEDPTLVSEFDPETGEETLAGMGELHLDIAVDRLRTEFGLTPKVSLPQVSYRETVREAVDHTATYKKQSGGHGHFAEVRLRVEPLPRGEGIVFRNEAPPSEFPNDFVRPAELGIRDALAKGVIAGYTVTDVLVVLTGGRAHEVDSAAIDFEIAGSMGVRQAIRRAAPALLEPIMHIDVAVAEEYLGAVVADIGRRRGNVIAMSMRGTVRSVIGEVPLAEARGYATALRSLTQGRGAFSLEFERYDFVPDSMAEEITRQRQIDGKVATR
ncbi:MAG: elongation factor G [Chloroflexi bacterium]|nr:elongation factor G [Chloroflexota bacterium]